MVLVASCLLTLPRLADVIWQCTIVVGMQIIVDGSLIHCRVADCECTSHAKAIHDGTPVAVGIRAVCLKLVHGRHHCPSKHRLPSRCLVHLLRHHSSAQPVSLDQAQWGIVSVQTLQRFGIGIDNLAGLVVSSFSGEIPRRFHIALAASLATAEFTVACHNLIRARHLIICLSQCAFARH